jgi:hypothetical protein
MSTDLQIEQAKSLPMNRKEEWIMERRAVDIEIEEMGADASPHMLICVSPEEGIVGTDIISPDAPDSEALSWALNCMLSPMEGKPRRPKSILLTGGGLDALRPGLEQTGVHVRIQSKSHPFVEAAASLIEQGMNEAGVPPYLFDSDMDPETVADFFRAAAEFYELKPWSFFNYEIPVKVVLRHKRPKIYWAVVMGGGGEQFGLSLFRSAADMMALFDAEIPDDTETLERKTPMFGFTFENVDEIGSVAELEYQANEWVLAADSAYPSTMVFDPSDEDGPRMPNKKELEDLTAVTRAATKFCSAYRKQIEEAGDEIEIVEETFTVPVSERQIQVFVEFPAPEFPGDDAE